MATIAIIGSGMMGSALAFPARENGNTVRLVGTPLDREIIDECRKTNRHPKFEKHFPEGVPPFPEGCEFYQFEQMMDADEVIITASSHLCSFVSDIDGIPVGGRDPETLRRMREVVYREYLDFMGFDKLPK